MAVSGQSTPPSRREVSPDANTRTRRDGHQVPEEEKWLDGWLNLWTARSCSPVSMQV